MVSSLVRVLSCIDRNAISMRLPLVVLFLVIEKTEGLTVLTDSVNATYNPVEINAGTGTTGIYIDQGKIKYNNPISGGFYGKLCICVDPMPRYLISGSRASLFSAIAQAFSWNEFADLGGAMSSVQHNPSLWSCSPAFLQAEAYDHSRRMFRGRSRRRVRLRLKRMDLKIV